MIDKTEFNNLKGDIVFSEPDPLKILHFDECLIKDAANFLLGTKDGLIVSDFKAQVISKITEYEMHRIFSKNTADFVVIVCCCDNHVDTYFTQRNIVYGIDMVVKMSVKTIAQKIIRKFARRVIKSCLS